MNLSLEISIQLFFFPFVFLIVFCDFSASIYAANVVISGCNLSFFALFNVGLESLY